MANQIRAFIAIELNQEIKNNLISVQEKLKKYSPNIKWAESDNIHLTLKFLGNISPSLVEKIEKMLIDIASRITSFRITTSKIGVFPKIENPKIIWMGIKEEGNNLLTLNKRLEEQLNSLGFPQEARTYQPHLTLGRVKYFKNIGRLKEGIESINKDYLPTGEMCVSEIKLIQSTLTKTGPIYTCLTSVKLAR